MMVTFSGTESGFVHRRGIKKKIWKPYRFITFIYLCTYLVYGLKLIYMIGYVPEHVSKPAKGSRGFSRFCNSMYACSDGSGAKARGQSIT